MPADKKAVIIKALRNESRWVAEQERQSMCSARTICHHMPRKGHKDSANAVYVISKTALGGALGKSDGLTKQISSHKTAD